MNDKFKLFKIFLAENFISAVSQRPLSLQARTDAASRCRRVERALKISLIEELDGSAQKLEAVESEIRNSRNSFNITGNIPDGIASLITAVRLYNKFVAQCQDPR